ncbi:MAG: hypothetical protein ACKODG_00855 [Betaproteobacteria bacterium]
MSHRPVPAQFASLQPFVEEWALGSEEERYTRLHQVSLAELRAFYDAMMACLPEALAFLDGFPLDALSSEARTIMDLAQTFAHTAHPIDLGWKDVDFRGACDWRKVGFGSISRSAARAREDDADPFAMW